MEVNSFVGAWPRAGKGPADREIIATLHRWTLAFLAIWTPLSVAIAYGLRDVSLDDASPAWLSMILFQALSLVVAGALAADVLVRTRRTKFSVLYLRKFHAEPREAFPINPFDPGSGLAQGSLRRHDRFRLASMLEGIGLLGVRVIALRDARTPGSGHVLFYLIPVYLALMLFAPAMLALWTLWAIAFATAAAADVAADYWGALAAAVLLLAVALLAVWPAARIWLRASMERHAEIVRGILIRGRRPKNLRELDKVIERARSVGPIAVRSSDENWRAFVARLLPATDAILFDVRASSANCTEELELIRDLNLQNRVLWLVSEGADLGRDAVNYRVGAVEFQGQPNLFEAFKDLDQPGFWSIIDIAHVRFLDRFVAALAYVRRISASPR